MSEDRRDERVRAVARLAVYERELVDDGLRWQPALVRIGRDDVEVSARILPSYARWPLATRIAQLLANRRDPSIVQFVTHFLGTYVKFRGAERASIGCSPVARFAKWPGMTAPALQEVYGQMIRLVVDVNHLQPLIDLAREALARQPVLG